MKNCIIAKFQIFQNVDIIMSAVFQLVLELEAILEAHIKTAKTYKIALNVLLTEILLYNIISKTHVHTDENSGFCRNASRARIALPIRVKI